MKIAMLYASWEKFGESWSTPMGFKAELISRGHEVTHFNLYHDDGMLPRDKMRKYSNQGINELFTLYNRGQYIPDVIFCMDYGPWDAVAFDKQYFPNSILVKECGDEPQAFKYHKVAAPRVHLLLSPDLRCTNWYNQNGFNAKWLTHCADTKIFYPRTNIAQVFDCVSTCGSRRVTAEIQKELGDRFNNERYFYGDDHANRLSMGKIVFQCSQFGEVTRRIFEGMACGRMVLTDRLAPETGLSEILTDGTDIVYYNSAQDAIDKINYYSSHDAEREAIAKNGHDKVMANHTVKQRIDVFEQEILNTIKEI